MPPKGVKEPKFDLKHIPFIPEPALDQEFGTDVGPVLEIDRMLHQARFLGVLKKAFPVKYFKKTGKVHCFCQEIRKHPGKLSVVLPFGYPFENRDGGWNFP